MTATSKILVLVAFAIVASPASAQLVRHEPGVTLDDISGCLTNLGLEKGTHFRKNPEKDVIQLNRAAVMGDFLNTGGTKADIDACWTKKGIEAAKATKSKPSKSGK